ncbi:MAG: RNA-directed DNA polymerase [Anaerolineae bacterium]
MIEQEMGVGRFLDYSLWEDACDLLALQRKQMDRNRHFHTLSMHYYRRLGELDQTVRSHDFYAGQVANGLFYGLSNTFWSQPYLVPKAGAGLRTYRLLSYPMRVLYYAASLYLLKLSQNLLQSYIQDMGHLRAEYGGALRFRGGRLHATARTIYFLDYYRRFRSAVRREALERDPDKAVLCLDVSDYYDQLPVPNLLDQLDARVDADTKAALRYDAATREQLASIIAFVSGGRGGIPQCDNDITSSFVGHLFMTFADLCIDQVVRETGAPVESHALTRYVDDVYLSLTFAPSSDVATRERALQTLFLRIADGLLQQLGIRLNEHKTRLYWLENSEDAEALQRSLHRVSPETIAAGETASGVPEEQVEAILSQLQALKTSPLDPSLRRPRVLDVEVLKQAFDPRVSEALEHATYQARIRELFRDMRLDVIKAYPLAILVIVRKDPPTAARLRDELLRRQTLTTADIDLILRLLSQEGFQDEALLEKLREDPTMRPVMERVAPTGPLAQDTDYLGLTEEQALIVGGIPVATEHLRRRVLREQSGAYGEALDHLLAEVRAVVRQVGSDDWQGEAPAAMDGSLEACEDLLSLYRQGESGLPRPVGREEYLRLRSQAGRCLQAVLAERQAEPETVG